jgi:hypothetical protein
MTTLIQLCKNQDFKSLKSFLSLKENCKSQISTEMFGLVNNKCIKLLLKFFKFIYTQNVEEKNYREEEKIFKKHLKYDANCSFESLEFFEFTSLDYVLRDLLIDFSLSRYINLENNYTIVSDYFFENFKIIWKKKPNVVERRILELSINKFYGFVNSIINMYNNIECEEKDIEEDSEIALKIFNIARPGMDYDFSDFSDVVKKGICLYKLSTEKDYEKNYNFLFSYETFKERTESIFYQAQQDRE